MVNVEPQMVLQYQAFGEMQTFPIPPFYIHDADEFFTFCQVNGQDTIRFERDADGKVILMPPSGSATGHVNSYIVYLLTQWSEAQEEPGYVFDSSSSFLLPNGAVRAPDISYIKKSRYEALSQDQREKHAPLAPDFVIEVMSPSDRLKPLQTKMEEYIANGVLLGWLIDREQHTVYVYRPNVDVETLPAPTEVSASPELPGFILPTERIFVPAS